MTYAIVFCCYSDYYAITINIDSLFVIVVITPLMINIDVIGDGDGHY